MPDASGIDPGKLDEAIAYAQAPANEGSPTDLGRHLVAQNTKEHDDGLLLGVCKDRLAVVGREPLREGGIHQLVNHRQWDVPHLR
ncbi:hypothetical protein MK139_05155, partial [bacterium]|nr:hypothetical protein [bacterium]